MKTCHLAFASLLFISSAAVLAQNPPTPAATSPQKPASHIFTKATPIYVSDFELQAQDVQVDSGLLGGEGRPGILGRLRNQGQEDPHAQARKLVTLMSSSIIADLRKGGYNALPLSIDDPRPDSGEWVHGVFAEVDEGNRLRRAVIGFGSGEAKMSLFVRVTDLASPEQPLYQTTEDSSSGKKPGAAITLNPYVAAAKFVIGKNATDNMVKKTAGQISKQIIGQLTQYEPKPATP